MNFTQVRIKFYLAGICLIAAVVTLFFVNRAQTAPSMPDTAEAHQIMAAMDTAYQIIGNAGQTFDASNFSQVFIDTTDYPLSDQQRAAVAGLLGESAAQHAGYLTAMSIQTIARGQGAKLLRTALDKAKAENRDLTAAEFQELIKANHGQLPTLGSSIMAKTTLTFNSIAIDGERATVEYDDGAALQKAILIRTQGKWLIASITPIWVHF